MAAGSEGRSKWILDACRMRLDDSTKSGDSSVVEQRSSSPLVAGSSPAPRSKPNMEALRAICARKGVGDERTLGNNGDDNCSGLGGDMPSILPMAEVPICGKTWWEDGENYECLMDKSHKTPKCGQRGMARNITE